MATTPDRNRAVQFVDHLGSTVTNILGGDSEASDEPRRADLVDGAEIGFIDPRAKARPLEDYGLVILMADVYPEPAILRCQEPFEIEAGSALVRAGSSSLLSFSGRRVTVRQFSLAPPDRVGELDPRTAELVPEALDGAKIPATHQAPDLVSSVLEKAE